MGERRKLQPDGGKGLIEDEVTIFGDQSICQDLWILNKIFFKETRWREMYM